MAETATIVAIGALAATAGSTYVAVDNANKQAKAARDSAQLEMNQYAEEKKAAADQAAQAEAQVRRNQAAANSALIARRAALGLDPFSPTGRTLLANNDNLADSDVETIWANSGRTINRLDDGAMASTLRMNSAINTANSQATGAVISGIGSIASTGYRYLSTPAPTTTPARSAS